MPLRRRSGTAGSHVFYQKCITWSDRVRTAMYNAQTPRLKHSPHANGFAWSDQGIEPSPLARELLSKRLCVTGGQCKAVASRIRTRSYKSVASQHCQLYHDYVVVAQLVATCFIKRVVAGSKPANTLRNTSSSSATVYSTVPARGLGSIPSIRPCKAIRMWGVLKAGGLCVVHCRTDSIGPRYTLLMKHVATSCATTTL